MAERRRSWNWRDRDGTDAASDDEMVVGETEMIVGLSLGQNYRLGTQAGEVWASVTDEVATPSPDQDPGAVHVQQQGRQSTLLTIGRYAAEVEQARAVERKADQSVGHARLELWDAVIQEREEQREVDEQKARAKTVNLSLVEDAPSWIFVVLIAVIMIGEWVLNRVPLEVAGDSRFQTDLLAAALAVGLVAAAHLGGIGVKRSLVRANSDSRPATPHLVLCGALLALALAAISMSGVRVAYFNSPLHEGDLDPPWLWLLLLQAFLLTVATLLSMAHDTPMRAELTRRQDLLDDAIDRVAEAKVALERARARHVDARFELRAIAEKALTEVQVQAAHTRRGLAEFTAGFQTVLGRPVPYGQPLDEPVPAIETWETWLTEAADASGEDVDELVRRWRTELDDVTGNDGVRESDTLDPEVAWQPPSTPEAHNGSRPQATSSAAADGR